MGARLSTAAGQPPENDMGTRTPNMPPKKQQKRSSSALSANSAAAIALETTGIKPEDETECLAVSAPTKKAKLQTGERNFQSAAPLPSFVVPVSPVVCSSPVAPSVQVNVLEPRQQAIKPLISLYSAEAGAASVAVATTPTDSRVHSGGRTWSQLRKREKGTYACVKAELLFRWGVMLDMDEADFNSLDTPTAGSMQRKIWCRRGDVRKKDIINTYMRGQNRLLGKEEMDAIYAKTSAAAIIRLPRGSIATFDSETSRAEAAHVSTGEDCVYVRVPTWEARLADEGIATHADLSACGILRGQPIPYDLKVLSAWQKKTARITRPGGI